jgi:5-enolpyruvylshikimate-3-phosphate synthase
MALAVAALAADGPAALDDDACVAISYPDFFAALAKLAPGA